MNMSNSSGVPSVFVDFIDSLPDLNADIIIRESEFQYRIKDNGITLDWKYTGGLLIETNEDTIPPCLKEVTGSDYNRVKLVSE